MARPKEQKLIRPELTDTDRGSVPATLMRNGRFVEEYLDELNSYIGSQKYKDMVRQDYQLARMLKIMTAPIMSATFEYIPIDADDEKQVHQATFKNHLWNKWGKRKWNQMLFELLTYLKYGFMIAEPYAHVVIDPQFGRVITLKNIGNIAQTSVREWKIKDGEVEEIRQIVTLPNGMYFDKWISGKELVILTNEQEGDNFEGVSILRSVYGNYVRKKLYLKIDMIGVEKMAVGTPVCFAPQYILDNPEELTKLQLVLSSYCAHENQYLILPHNLKGGEKDKGFYIEKGEYNSEAVQNSIMREDTTCLDTILASFQNIGVYRSGGNSQNEGQMGMFLNSLLAVAQYIAENRDEIAHSYYVMNFGEPEVRLDTKISGITKDDATKTMEILRGYVISNVVRPDDRLEKFVRDKLNLPEADMESVRDQNATGDPNSDPIRKTKEDTAEPQKNPENPKKKGH